MASKYTNWVKVAPDSKLGTLFGVKDDQHPNGHRGTDYKLASGTQLPALADNATYITSYWSEQLGNVIVQQIGSNYISYCHCLTASSLKPGTKLKAGQPIGKSGNTGTATSGAHVHVTRGTTERSAVSGTVTDYLAWINQKIAEEKNANL